MSTIASWDGRVSIELNVTRGNIIPTLLNNSRYNFFVIMPYYNPAIDDNGNTPSSYLLYTDSDSGTPEQILPCSAKMIYQIIILRKNIMKDGSAY